MTDPAAVAWRIVVDAAREAYAPRAVQDETIPIDRTCPGCGELRDGCDSGLCSMRHDDEED